jgi:hypothetical protein
LSGAAGALFPLNEGCFIKVAIGPIGYHAHCDIVAGLEVAHDGAATAQDFIIHMRGNHQDLHERPPSGGFPLIILCLRALMKN